MKKVLVSIAILTASAAIAAAQADRIGTQQWKLVQLNGSTVSASSRAYLKLEPGHTRFVGHTGCNSMFGTASVEGRRIDLSNIGMTRMACTDPRVRRVETAFVRALENVDRYRRSGNTLELYDRGRLVARFIAPTKQEPEDNGRVRLEDRKWMLEAINGVAVSKAGRVAFVVFDDRKKSAGGNSNCNVFGGSYTATDSSITISDVISTMRACEEADRMTIEREFLDGLRRADRYAIERGMLKLYRNNRLLLTLNGEQK